MDSIKTIFFTIFPEILDMKINLNIYQFPEKAKQSFYIKRNLYEDAEYLIMIST